MSDKEVALYYPYIDIADASLVKTAALYWDKLQTIVPLDSDELYADSQETPSVTEFYKTDVSREAKKEGFLEERMVHPMDESVQQTGRDFILDIRKTPEIKEKLANILRSPQWRQAGPDKYRIIYMEKFSPNHLLNLVYELKETGIQFNPITDGSNGIIVPKLFYDMYMSRMASIIAQNDDSVPLTNEDLWQDAALDRLIDYSGERANNQSQLVTMSLQTISINVQVPLIEILRFRDKHRQELLNFRRQIRRLSLQITQGLNSAEKQSVFEEIINDNVLPAKDEIEAKLNENGITFLVSTLGISLPTVLMITISGNAWPAVFAGGAITLTTMVVNSIRKDRSFIKNKPLGYLYKAQQELGTR